jgi:uncharacterized protein (TIGR02246 family)
MDDAGRIAAARATFIAALSNGDAEGVAGHYRHDASLLAPSADLIRGREAIEAFWRAGVQAGVHGLEVESLTLDGAADLAYEVGSYTLRLRTPEGKTVLDRGKYVLVHERQVDGNWLRAVETFRPDMPA